MRRLASSCLPLMPAVVTTSLIALVGWLFPTVGQQTAFALGIGGTLVSGYYGGFRSGVAATVLAALFLLFMQASEPISQGATDRADLLGGLLLFPLVGLMASYLGHECQRCLQAIPRPTPPAMGDLVPAVVIDGAGRIVALNRPAATLLGQAQGRLAAEVLRLYDEENEQQLPSAETTSREASLRLEDGADVPIEFQVTALADSGLLFTFRDLTPEQSARDAHFEVCRAHERTRNRVAELEETERGLRDQLAQTRQNGEGLRREQAQRHLDWQAIEKRLRGELAARENETQELHRQIIEEREVSQKQQQAAEDVWRQEKSRLRESIDAREHEAQEWQAKHDGLSRQQAENGSLSEKIAAELRSENLTLTQSLAALREQLAKNAQEQDALQHRLGEEARRSHDLERRCRAEIEALTVKYAEARSEVKAAEEMADALRRQLTESQDRRQQIEDQLRRESATHHDHRTRLEAEAVAHGKDAEALRQALTDKELVWQERERCLEQRIADACREADTLRQTLAERDQAREAALHQSRIGEEQLRHEGDAHKRLAGERLDQLQCLRHELDASGQRQEDLLGRFIDTARPLLATSTTTAATARERSVNCPEMAAPAEALEGQLTRMAMLLEALDAVSRLGRGNLTVDVRPLEVDALLEAVVARLSLFLRERGHHLTVEVPLEPLCVLADPTRLSQALEQLLDNAARYAAPGGALHLSAQREGASVVIRVRDNGIGLPERDRLALREVSARDGRFHRGEGDGLGVGLALARGLIELQEGTLEINVAPSGQGSEAEVRLRAAAVASSPPALRVVNLEEETPLSKAG